MAVSLIQTGFSPAHRKEGATFFLAEELFGNWREILVVNSTVRRELFDSGKFLWVQFESEMAWMGKGWMVAWTSFDDFVSIESIVKRIYSVLVTSQGLARLVPLSKQKSAETTWTQQFIFLLISVLFVL